MLIISIHSVLLWLTAILIIGIDVIIYIGSDKTSSKLFSLFSLFVGLWSVSYGFLISFDTSTLPLILIKINHVLGLISSVGFLFFSISYPNDNKIPTLLIYLMTVFSLIYSSLILFSDLMIVKMFPVSPPDRWGWDTGILYFSYSIVFTILWIIILINIHLKTKHLKDDNELTNQRFMFWGLLLGIIPPAALNIILPTFKIYGVSWTGPIASAIWIFIIGYSIIKYRQMNVKVVITEMLAIAMTVIFFINIFIKAELGRWESVATFLIFLFLAIYLIKSILTETKTRDELKKLNDTLEQKVMEQTTEIRKSYETEKQARRDLEKLNETKNQFILITQHSIRTPLLHIQNYINSLSERDAFTQETRVYQALTGSISRLTKITNDFLNITSIDSSNKILNIKSESVLPIIEHILEEIKYDISVKNLTVTVDRSPDKWPDINIDRDRIYDALLIIIENAIKYNIPNGTISITSYISKNLQTIKISDSGFGISTKDKEKIESGLFYRGEAAKKSNPIGMGVGLNVARTVIGAHHGSIDIVSAGLNQGTTVTVSLPIDYIQYVIDIK